MVSRIIWTAHAEKNFEAIVLYLTTFFGEPSVQDFASALKRKLNSIESNPHLYRIINKKRNIRKAVIHKRCIVFYRYKTRKQEVELIALWDTRQKPKYT